MLGCLHTALGNSFPFFLSLISIPLFQGFFYFFSPDRFVLFKNFKPLSLLMSQKNTQKHLKRQSTSGPICGSSRIHWALSSTLISNFSIPRDLVQKNKIKVSHYVSIPTFSRACIDQFLFFIYFLLLKHVFDEVSQKKHFSVLRIVQKVYK